MQMDLADKSREVWGYAESPDSEAWQGTDSREAAEDGASELEGGGYIQRGFYPDPAAVVSECFDLDTIMERIDEFAADSEFVSLDEPIFEAEDGAAEALVEALSKWARKYVRAVTWTATDDEPIRVEPSE